VRYVPNPYHSSAPSLSGCSSRCARNNSCGDGGGAAGPTPHVTLSHHGSTKNDGPVLSSCMFTASLSWQMMVGLHHRKWPRKTLSPHRNGGDRLNRAERQSACTEGTGSSTPQQSPCTKRHSSFFLKFSLSLSRACLGKMMHFIHEWRKRTRFSHRFPSAECSVGPSNGQKIVGGTWSVEAPANPRRRRSPTVCHSSPLCP
jgi:hypothetical protein